MKIISIKKICRALSVLFILPFFLPSCKKKDVIIPLEGTPVVGTGNVDVSWTFDKAHSNVNWETKYMDYSSGMLTGRFNNFGFFPKFTFNESNLNLFSLNAWVQLSSVDSGELGRDGPGKCIRSYMGVTYLATNKTITDPLSDTAWFRSTSISRSGNGFVVRGSFYFNRYRSPSGYPDGSKIVKPALLYLFYNGTRDFDTNGDNITDRYRASFTGRLSFLRSDHMDVNSTIQWVPVPSMQDLPGNTVAANNKTYGVWTTNVADQMYFTMHMQFYKNH